MFCKLRCDFYRLNMSTDVELILSRRTNCTRNDRKYWYWRKLRLFQARRLLNFVSMDVHRPFPKRIQDNDYIVFLKERYFKLIYAIPMPETTVTQLVNIFIDYWVIPYGISNLRLEDIGPHFACKFVAIIYTFFSIWHVTTTTYCSMWILMIFSLMDSCIALRQQVNFDNYNGTLYWYLVMTTTCARYPNYENSHQGMEATG